MDFLKLRTQALLNATIRQLPILGVCWLTCKDWLTSGVYWYPYPAEAWIFVSAIVGTSVARHVKNVRALYLTVTVLIVALTVAAKASASFPALLAALIGITTPLLFARSRRSARHKVEAVSVTFLVLTALVIVVRNHTGSWRDGLIVSLVVAGTFGICRGLRKIESGAPRLQSLERAAIVLSVALVLAGSVPVFCGDPEINAYHGGIAAVWLGGGLDSYVLGHPVNVASGSWNIEIVREQGLASIIIFGLLIICAYARGLFFLLSAGQDGSELDTNFGRVRLTALDVCIAMICSLSGLLICDRFVPSFLTSDTSTGTSTIALVLSALWVASSQDSRYPAPAKNIRCRRLVNSACFAVSIASAFGFFCTWLWLLGLAHRAMVNVPLRTVEVATSAYVPLNCISQPMQDATLAMEDHLFYAHHGFDWRAIHHALRIDIRDGRVSRGGSSITQQLVKNLFLTNDRTIERKVRETAYSVEIEQSYSKSEILGFYFNVVDYGMGQRGIGAASKYYFHTTPDRLTLAQSVFLVALVPRPPKTDIHPYAYRAGIQKALRSVVANYPDRYSISKADLAWNTALDQLVYPWKDAWDRGATETIPAVWHGVTFQSVLTGPIPEPIHYASPLLKIRFGQFVNEVHYQYGVVEIDHLGVYDDRPVRGERSGLSAHAFGQAIDISGFRFRDGSRVLVADHANPTVSTRLAPLEAALRKRFDFILDWNTDPIRHGDHFHAEVKTLRNTQPRPPSVNTPPSMGKLESVT